MDDDTCEGIILQPVPLVVDSAITIYCSELSQSHDEVALKLVLNLPHPSTLTHLPLLKHHIIQLTLLYIHYINDNLTEFQLCDSYILFQPNFKSIKRFVYDNIGHAQIHGCIVGWVCAVVTLGCLDE